MQTYIALLRGINVSGQKLIKMADLRESLTKGGLAAVRTYIQSGNIIFESALNDYGPLESRIKEIILKDFGYEVPVMVKTAAHLKAAVANNPFPDQELTRLHLVLLDKEPEKELVKKLKEIDYSPEEFEVDGENIYFYSPLGLAKAKMGTNLFESKLKVTATGRNWRTVNKLIDLAEK